MFRRRQIRVPWSPELEPAGDSLERQLQEPLVLIEGVGDRAQPDESGPYDPSGIRRGHEKRLAVAERAGSTKRSLIAWDADACGRIDGPSPREGCRNQLKARPAQFLPFNQGKNIGAHFCLAKSGGFIRTLRASQLKDPCE